MKCTHCGADLAQGQVFCHRCGTGVTPARPDSSMLGEPTTVPPPPPVSTYTAGWQPSTPAPYAPAPTPKTGAATQYRLAAGENLEKTFEISGATKQLGWVKAQLLVTNQRVVYRSLAKHMFGESQEYNEIQIKDVNGSSLFTRRGFTPVTLLSLVLGTVIAWIVCSPLATLLALATSMGGGRYPSQSNEGIYLVLLRIVVVVIAAVVALVRWRSRAMTFVVHARMSVPTALSAVGSIGRSRGALALSIDFIGGPLVAFLNWLGVYDCLDSGDHMNLEDVQAVCNELGALVLEIQARDA